MDITQLILDDHHEQRRRFAMLQEIGAGESETLAAVWKRLAALLDLHALAEEELFYPALLKLGQGTGEDDSAAPETEDAIHDHNEIRDAVAEVGRHRPGTADWFAAVAKADEVNGDHMAEEEREGLADFRRHAPLEVRHELAVAFAGFEARHAAGVKASDEDPQAYVAKHSP